MIMQGIKNLSLIVTAAVSSWLIVLSVWFFTALTALLSFLSGPSRTLVPVLSVMGGFLWFMMGSGCLLMAHHAYQLRLARLGKQTARALLLIYVLASVLPALLAKSVATMLAINTIVATTILLFLMLPPQWARLVPLVPLLLSPNLGLTHRLSVNSFGPDTFWYVALFMLCATWLRWRALRQKSIGEMRLAVFAMSFGGYDTSTGANNPKSLQRQQPAWISPRAGSRNATTPFTRLRTALGASFAPGAWQRQSIFLFAMLLVLTLYQWNFHNPGGHERQISLLSELGLLMLMSVTPLTPVQQAQVLFRRESHDLAELALLPGLPNRNKVSWLKRATLLTAFLQSIGTAAGLLMLLVIFHQLSLVKLALLIGGATIGVFASATQVASIALYPRPDAPMIKSFQLLIAILPADFAWYFTTTGAATHDIFTALSGLTVFSIWLAIHAWLHARWYKQLALRPHPYVQT